MRRIVLGAPEEHVIVAILTDGLENASADYTYEAISRRIDEMRRMRTAGNSSTSAQIRTLSPSLEK
jgi:hypothetical protein